MPWILQFCLEKRYKLKKKKNLGKEKKIGESCHLGENKITTKEYTLIFKFVIEHMSLK